MCYELAGEKRSRDLGCDLFFEISVREEVDVAKNVIEDLYFRWKYNHSHHNHNQPHHVHPTTAVTPTLSHHFGRRCLETFAGRCSTNKSNSMDIISEREDGVLPISLSLGMKWVMNYFPNFLFIRRLWIAFLESPLQDGPVENTTPEDKFRSRASTEGSLSLSNKRSFLRHYIQPIVLDQPPIPASCNLVNKRPVRRMSISLRGTNSAF